ncbi:MAG: hypothetical protein LBP62_08195 [Clostridiales bacterium]|jgi:hypothetical protein|nr:hypothetical protein [Clostridiales bacterium]
MAKSWYTYLVPAEEKRIEPPFIVPSAQKKGRIKKTIDIMFIEYTRLFRVNLLVGAAFLPFLIYVFSVFLDVAAVQNSLGYALNTGIGWPLASADNAAKLAALIGTIQARAVYAFLFALIPGPLLAGAFDVTKLLMWQNSEVKVFSTLIKAVKKNWWKYTVLYSVFCAGALGVAELALGQYQAALLGSAPIGGYVGLGFSLLALLTYFVFMMYAFSMIPVYGELKFLDALKNGALYTFGIYPLNIIFAIVCFSPVLVVFTGSVTAMTILFIAAVFLLLTLYAFFWTSFCQYGFENFLNKVYEIYVAENAKIGGKKAESKNIEGKTENKNAAGNKKAESKNAEGSKKPESKNTENKTAEGSKKPESKNAVENKKADGKKTVNKNFDGNKKTENKTAAENKNSETNPGEKKKKPVNVYKNPKKKKK